MTKLIKIATRKSKLALWQADHVADLLQQKGFQTQLVHVVTKGDRILDIPLAEIGGKGLFLKEIEDTLIRGEADIAVHSMKDVPSEMVDELVLAAMLERANPSDALIGATSFEALPKNAVVGTASLRRHAQIVKARPDVIIKTLRGNVDTRLAKLHAGEYDGIVLATAGLQRLGLDHHIGMQIPEDIMLPAVSQGCVGIQTRADDQETFDIMKSLEHKASMLAVSAERACNAALGGSCHAPIAVKGSWITQSQLRLEAMAANLQGTMIKAQLIQEITCTDTAKSLGLELAEVLFAKGAKALLAQTLNNQ